MHMSVTRWRDKVSFSMGQCGSSGNRFSLNRFSTDKTLHMPSVSLLLLRDQKSAEGTLATSGVAPLLTSLQEVTMKLRQGRGRKGCLHRKNRNGSSPCRKHMARLLDGTTDHTRGNYLPDEATRICFFNEIEPWLAYSEDLICFWFKKHQRPAVKMGKK